MVATPQATPFDGILAQCRDLFCERLSSALAGMLDKSDDALLAYENEARDPNAQELYRKTREKVLAQRETIEAQFRARYLREFQQRSNRAKKIGSDLADIDLSTVELALVGEDDLNETLKFNALAAKLRQYCDEELMALDQRVGVLFGDAGLPPEDNPFTPQAICDAYKLTCGQVDSNVENRMVLLKLFDDYVLDDIRGIYKAVNALLVQNSILPKLRGAGSARQERGKEAPTGAKAAEPDFFSVLQNLMSKGPSGETQTVAAGSGVSGPATAAVPVPAQTAGQPGAMAGAVGAPQVLQGAELLQSLTRVQLGDMAAVTGASLPLAAIVAEPGTTNVLRELKATSLGSGLSQMDAMTLDIVALLFDQLFDDSKIPIGVKGLIGRLQIPFLKVAIADKAFFSKKTHPARLMLDALGEVASRLPADVNASHPAFARLDRILQELMESFEDDIGIFDLARERLQALIAEQDQRIEEQTQSAEKQIEQEEALALAKTVAQTQIKVRLQGGKVPRPVFAFLYTQWVKVLLLIQVKQGEDSEAWKNALDTMDLLIWSVEPKNGLEDRRELVGKVPQLLRQLADGLSSAGVDEEIRTRFFADLRKLHSGVIASAGKTGLPVPDQAGPQIAAMPGAPASPAELPAIEFSPSVAAPKDAALPFELPAIRLEAPPAAAPAGSALAFELPAPEPGPAPAAPPGGPAPALEAPAIDAVPANKATPQKSMPRVEPPPAPTAAGRPGPPATAKPLRPSATPSAEAAPLDLAAPITVSNPFGEGEVEVADLDFTVELRSGPAGAKPAPAIPANLAVGTWVGILQKGEREPRQVAKLSFVSPLKTRFLFVDRHGKTILECSQAELARRFQLGEMIITKEARELPLFDRIAEGMVSKLGQRK